MAVESTVVARYLQFFPEGLISEIAEFGDLAEIPEGTQLLREGQYVKVLPIVLNGLVRVFTQVEDRELLLYYIQPSESCVMSFSSIITNHTSRISAITEEDSLILLLPSEKMADWIREFPKLNELFFQQYNARYLELLDTIHQLLFNRLDQRLFGYLAEVARVKGTRTILVKHREIAQQLGTSREVITRAMRKLEAEGKIRQTPAGIELVIGL
jgi:CRP/FNR family transcriptional regulator